MMELKINFHSHTGDDPKDKIKYSAFELIDEAKKLNFDVLAITCHYKFTHKKEYARYAEKKNILLIPGIEAKIEKKHVIILNCDKKAEEIKTFNELKEYKKQNPRIFIIAPHPFVPNIPRVSLAKKLVRHIDLFDAIELTVFSNKFFNFNKKARLIAEKYDKPLVATSDTHYLRDLNRGYIVIDAREKTVEAILQALKQKNHKNKITPMSPLDMLKFKTMRFK